jgi:NodT family efflux transporter outer membrane factor (OMF) lipoprotein
MMAGRIVLFALFMPVLALWGCSLPIEQTGAGLVLPGHWRAPAGSSTLAVDAEWWRSFGSHELSGLVVAARASSFDVVAAAARVRQADALARIAGAALLPAVDGAASAGRSKAAGDTGRTSYTVRLAASYELDIWGAHRAIRQAAVDTLSATAYARDAVVLTLTAGVADTYLQTLALRERAHIARQNRDTGERILALVESQYRAGAATALDLAQQKTLVAQLRQVVALYDQQARNSLTALATLMGRAPQEFEVVGAALEAIDVPMADAGVPSNLLTRRPDVAQAERQLAAADADVTVARAAMLPSITLTASAGVGGDRLRGLFDRPIYDLAAGLAAPIFNARREELLADYRKAIVDALGDVEAALNAIDGLQYQQQAQREALEQAREAVRLAESRYRAGADTLLALLDAQRTLYAAQDQTVRLRSARLQAAVALYKALGGGWQVPDGSNERAVP